LLEHGAMASSTSGDSWEAHNVWSHSRRIHSRTFPSIWIKWNSPVEAAVSVRSVTVATSPMQLCCTPKRRQESPAGSCDAVSSFPGRRPDLGVNAAWPVVDIRPIGVRTAAACEGARCDERCMSGRSGSVPHRSLVDPARLDEISSTRARKLRG
jgi:hypothetical protein